MRRAKLTEGMRPGDLEDLVLPLISVDEFESKVDPKAVVVGLYVFDKDPANDLNRFIQKSAVSILDTEVSPAPDQHGYYLVFVEFLNNDRFGENVNAILTEIAPLGAIDEWQMRVRKSEGSVPFSIDALVDALGKARSEEQDTVSKVAQDVVEDAKKGVLEFLAPSALSDASLTEEQLCVVGASGSFRFRIVGFGEAEEMIQSHNLLETAISMNLRDAAFCNRLARTLGEGWNAHRLGDHLVVQHEASTQLLLVREIGV